MNRLQFKIQRTEIILKARRNNTGTFYTVLPKKTVAARAKNEDRRLARELGIEVVG